VLQCINNHSLKSEVAITICYQLCSTHYQPVQINKYLKSNCVIKVAGTKNTEFFFVMKGLALFAVSKDEWNTKEGTGESMNNHLFG